MAILSNSLLGFVELNPLRRGQRRKRAQQQLPTELFINPYRTAANDTIRYIDVYMIYSGLNYRQRRRKLKCFFKRSIFNLDERLDTKTIFISREKALSYARSMDASFAVIRAIVPDSAIVSHGGHLSIRSDVLDPQNIHGCFPGQGKGKIYYENPHFKMD